MKGPVGREAADRHNYSGGTEVTRRVWPRILALVASMALVVGPIQPVLAVEPATGMTASEQTALQERAERVQARRDLKVTQEEREAAVAARNDMLKELGMDPEAETGSVSSLAALPVPGDAPDYFGMTPNWANSPQLRKFVDGLPGVGPDNANNLGQYLAVAHPDTVTYPGTDYYEIELREYSEQLHSDLPPTLLRGYVQTNKGTDESGNNTIEPDPIHYLGPTVFAQKDRPVRVKFTNALPTGEGGDLFIPVDKSYMGAGEGPEGGMYTENRAVVHLHGGKTVWISDGTPHQWITPAGEETTYPVGVSVRNVPDMPDPGDGSTTLFYSNQQSARMLWYHDHAYGITRLNVYAGMASGYFLTDETEKELVDDGLLPEDQIPLIIQDKTFTDADTIMTTDPLWEWGSQPGTATTGDLWFPHVYMPAQNPAMPDGVAAMGRWHYGPWFWPPTPVPNGPIPNPYYDPVNAPWENETMPGTPFDSSGMEAFQDTPVINGTAYPTLEVDPKSYRLRILNAASDRFWNLQFYEADPSVISCDGRRNTEVKMVPAAANPTFPDNWPIDGREGGVPDPSTVGPDWIQVATEGGFLPQPVVVENQPITWVTDVTLFNAGNVDSGGMMVAPAERVDAVVDFSQYAGKTLILYNDAPAAWPAGDPRYDYFTGAPDMRDTGGVDSPMAGYGPNTRTLMQIKVAPMTPAEPFDLDKLMAEFESTDSHTGVFERSQNKILIPDARYNSTYNETFTADPYVRIFQTEHTFDNLDGDEQTFPLEPKAIQDEQGETFDEYGRMSGKMGLERPSMVPGAPNFNLYGYMDPPTENLEAVDTSMVPLSAVMGDGTQVRKITHNGVDTHPMHFHLYDVQLINRVGWDGFMRYPLDNELGWKDTVRVSPLEDTIVALRPVIPESPFGVPDSKRLLDPTMPVGSAMGFSRVDPTTGLPYVTPITNQIHNFFWEYVWHCHILSHEEMDMMRPVSVHVETTMTATPSIEATLAAPGGTLVTWTDATDPNDAATWGDLSNEIGFKVERASVSATGLVGSFFEVGAALANQESYRDDTIKLGESYEYRVVAYNEAGDAVSSSVPVGPIVDTTSPLTTSNIDANWHMSPFSVTLEATDTLSGVASMLYNVDGGSDTTYTMPFDISGEGTHPVEYWSIDASGNVEAVNSQDVLIDDTKPMTTDDHTSAYTGSATVNLSPSDALAGIAYTMYSLDGASAVRGTKVKTSVLGNHTLSYWSVDAAGNVETAHNIAFKVNPSTTSFDEFSGANRIATALQLSRDSFPMNSVDTVVIASSDSWPDALVGSSLAGAYRSPILLTAPGSMPSEVVTEIRRLGATKAVLLGGTVAISNTVKTSLGSKLGASNVTRIGGSDRYGTARLIAEETARILDCNYDGTAILTTGLNYADALAVGPLAAAKGWPIYLVGPIGLGPSNIASMNSLGVEDALVLGGTTIMPKAIADSVVANVGATTKRLGGADRYATGIIVATYGVTDANLHWNQVAIATGQNFPDGLAAGAAQGYLGSVLLLTPSKTLDSRVGTTLSMHKDEIVEVRYIGGTTALTPAVRSATASRLN